MDANESNLKAITKTIKRYYIRFFVHTQAIYRHRRYFLITVTVAVTVTLLPSSWLFLLPPRQRRVFFFTLTITHVPNVLRFVKVFYWVIFVKLRESWSRKEQSRWTRLIKKNEREEWTKEKKKKMGKAFLWYKRHKEANLLRRWRITSCCGEHDFGMLKTNWRFTYNFGHRINGVHCLLNRHFEQ